MVTANEELNWTDLRIHKSCRGNGMRPKDSCRFAETVLDGINPFARRDPALTSGPSRQLVDRRRQLSRPRQHHQVTSLQHSMLHACIKIGDHLLGQS